MKKIIKKIIFSSRLLNEYLYEYYRYLFHSSLIFNENKNKAITLQSRIISQVHTIEKGLTMPEVKLGFGKEKLLKLINDVNEYLVKFSSSNEMVTYAVSVIKEYSEFHSTRNYQLSTDLVSAINDIIIKKEDVEICKQIEVTKTEYFSETNSNFEKFSKSRKSIRNYSLEKIDINIIEKSIELALNAPSSCNRQSARVYVFSDKEQIKHILKVQGGNRGFGHLTDKLLLITSEMGVSTGYIEKNIGYIDGGMFAMNLLYSLHYNKVAACSLNCNFTPKEDRLMRRVTGAKDSEAFVLIITCGHAEDEFNIAVSKRLAMDNIITVN